MGLLAGARDLDEAAAWSQPSAALDHRQIAAMRLVLAAGALLITYLVPFEPDRLVGLTYTLLSLYTLYSAWIYVMVLLRRRAAERMLDWAHWVDVAWYTGLITLTRGTNSIFFYGFFFVILVASFRWGFAPGMRVALVSAVLFSAVGYLTAPDPSEFEQRFLIRPMYLLVLGYLMARWGGLEVAQRRRLEFLKGVSAISGPHLSVDQVAGLVLHRLTRLFEADASLLLMESPRPPGMTLRRVSRSDPEGAAASQRLPDELSRILLSLDPDSLVAYRRPDAIRDWPARPEGGSPGKPGASAGEAMRQRCESLAVTLEADAFVTVPLAWRKRNIGRLYVLSRRPRRFTESDGEFLLQVVDHILPLVEHLQLLDRLAADAAREERRKIALDLHDSVIQPYLGLQLGLAALRQKLGPDDGRVRDDVERLMEMIGVGIENVRGRVLTLREEAGSPGGFVPAIQRFAAKFTEISGIGVTVNVSGEIGIGDRLAADAFHMVAEGLSNIRRHTRASRAALDLECRDGRFLLRIENGGWDDPNAAAFTPRSITERAAALGGRVGVERLPDGGAAVTIEIPVSM